jgi:hypothetical protein
MSKKLMCIRNVIGLVSLVAVVTVTGSCGDVVRSSRSPVLFMVTSVSPSPLASDVIGPTVVVNDVASATLSVTMKDVTIAPSATNNRVTVNRYHVTYRRADGHNTAGVDVPYPFDGAVTATIAPGTIVTVSFELVRHVAKAESPLVQLTVNRNIISAIADVTFFGQDAVGNDVSATGSTLIDFGNF